MKSADRIYFGGDYNPEQWDQATIDADMRLFKQANINLLTLPVFAWAKLEPREGVYDFGWLDALLEQMHANGIGACLATPTTAQPAWLSKQYPEVLPADIKGRKRTHGMRVFFCYNSPKYRERAKAIAMAMARRYRDHPALRVWHVANEYGTYCYCDNCQRLFRLWLKARYNTLDELNSRWHTAFWGRTLYDWDEIMLPTELNDDYRFCPAVQLDYQRFVTESTIACFRNEYDAIRLYDKDTPIQTNISGFIKKLDQFKMAAAMDTVGWDNYPAPGCDRSLTAFKHDIMRGLKDGQSYMLVEQSPNQQNWQPYNKLKRPGEVKLLSYQALARGADTCLFFQMRQSIAGQEKFHGAIISRSGANDTRVFREIEQLGAELLCLGDIVGASTRAGVGLLFDWDNWWAIENSSGPNRDIDYLEFARLFYEPFYRRNIPVDILGFHRRFEGYKVIVAPMVYMLKPGLYEKLKEFVYKGGVLIGTVLTGVADENDRCVFGEYPGPLSEIFGLSVEETDALRPNEFNEMRMTDSRAYPCGLLCDLVRLRGAQTLAVYRRDFYAGRPCFTVNHYGEGSAYYIASRPDARFLLDFVDTLGLESALDADDGVEVARRENANGVFCFLLNHNDRPARARLAGERMRDMLTGERFAFDITLAPLEVRVLRKDD